MPQTAQRGQRRRTMNEINMVPFIDVMLVLLIIFMVTAPLIAPSLIALPSVGKAAKQPDRVVQVLVAKDERLEVKNGDKTTAINLKDIAPAVLQAQSG
jgi:biopolymer transport protein TolR